MKKFYTAFAASLITAGLFAQCNDLFFSEYVEGSSSNKAIEIYNPTPVTISLAGYKVQLYSNGASTPNTTFNLSGSIAAGGVYVIANGSANNTIKAWSDTTSSVTNYNGDDAVVLLNGTDTLDIIGVVGLDPGNSWLVGLSDSTQDRSLVRADTVHQGTTNWALSATQWVGYPKDTIHLGTHVMQPCGAVTDTLVRFSPTSATVSETAGTYDLTLLLNAPSTSTTFTVDVALTGGTGTAADIDNYTTQTVTFNPNTGSVLLTIHITDDTLPESAETLVFRLTNPTGGLQLGADSVFTLTIGINDQPVHNLTIAQVTGLDSTYTPDSVGVKVKVTGTVIGINYRSTGLEFFIHDATDGISIFSPASDFGYSVAEGDSIAVQGEVSFYNGLAEIQYLDTLYKIGVGVVPLPVVAQDLDETTESELVRLNNVHLVTPSQWSNSGSSGFYCDVTDGQNTWSVKIDEQCALYSATSPGTTSFDIIGIGSQNDNSSPYNSGYFLLPRFSSDLILHTVINNLTVNPILIYPNPATQVVNISTPTAWTNALLRLTDLSGKVISEQFLTGNNAMLNTAALQSGIYLITIQNQQQVFRSKVYVTK